MMRQPPGCFQRKAIRLKGERVVGCQTRHPLSSSGRGRQSDRTSSESANTIFEKHCVLFTGLLPPRQMPAPPGCGSEWPRSRRGVPWRGGAHARTPARRSSTLLRARLGRDETRRTHPALEPRAPPRASRQESPGAFRRPFGETFRFPRDFAPLRGCGGPSAVLCGVSAPENPDRTGQRIAASLGVNKASARDACTKAQVRSEKRVFSRDAPRALPLRSEFDARPARDPWIRGRFAISLDTSGVYF
ncbi:Hypothetical protein I5071_44570 [Sandaracinus amylolyticus]|nr:Hypothetical protein I5071_44570 [Sandaracinus amylolyticus]